MDDGINLPLGNKHLLKLLYVTEVILPELRGDPGDGTDTLQHRDIRVVKVIDDHHLKSARYKLDSGV